MLVWLLLGLAVRRDLTVRGQGQAIQTLTSKYKEKIGTGFLGQSLVRGGAVENYAVGQLRTRTRTRDGSERTNLKYCLQVADFLTKKLDGTRFIWRVVSGRDEKMDVSRNVLASKWTEMPVSPVFSPMKIPSC